MDQTTKFLSHLGWNELNATPSFSDRRKTRMEQTWRWWGPTDIITLAHVCQVGATGIVTALHDVPSGELWSAEAIAERKRFIEADATLGLRWSVVESLPISEKIKLGDADLTGLL